jgi:tetratricopeptide (TPR) repeat protein
LRVTGHKVVSLDISGWLKKMLLFIFVVLSINFLYTTLQNIAFTKYLSAINYLKSEDIVSARTNIDQAIAIMPMDIFFIDRILIYGYEFNKIISLDPRNEDKARQLYKDTVTAQLQDGLSAIKHNPYNYNNYVVLANLYSEKAITEYFNFVSANSSVQSVQVQSLTNSSDETYISAIEYYDKAIKVSQDDAIKAEIEALKAILSFKLQKIESFEKSMDKALSLNPKSKSALFLKSQYLGLKGQYKEASNLAFSILSGDEQDLEIYKHIAKMLFVQEDYVESSKYFLLYYRDSGQKDIESLYNAALAIKKSKSRIEDFEILLQTLEKILGPDNQAFIELKSKTK